MKPLRTLALLPVIGALAVATPAALGNTRIAVLNVARVFEQYEMTRDLESLFDRARRDAADEAERRRGNLEQMRRSLSAFDPDSEDFLRREQELTRNEIDFQVWSKSTDRRLKSDHLRWMKKIYRNTQDTIATLARERNLDLVLTYDELADDAPDSVALRQQILLQKVIYHDARVDITDEVLNRLNTTYRNSGGIRSLDSRAPAGAMQPTSPGVGQQIPGKDPIENQPDAGGVQPSTPTLAQARQTSRDAATTASGMKQQ
jgi:Skp family chaperone for outer membrane proteins